MGHSSKPEWRAAAECLYKVAQALEDDAASLRYFRVSSQGALVPPNGVRAAHCSQSSRAARRMQFRMQFWQRPGQMREHEE